MEANFNIRSKTFSTFVAYDARSAGNVARFIRNPASVSVTASRCRHWLFVTLFIFLVACERPETKKTETAERPESAPAPTTANNTAAVPRGSYAEVVDNVAPAVVTIRAE